MEKVKNAGWVAEKKMISQHIVMQGLRLRSPFKQVKVNERFKLELHMCVSVKACSLCGGIRVKVGLLYLYTDINL